MEVKNIIGRLREPSTWAGFTGLFVLFGLNVEAAQAVANAGAALSAMAAVLMAEGK